MALLGTAELLRLFLGIILGSNRHSSTDPSSRINKPRQSKSTTILSRVSATTISYEVYEDGGKGGPSERCGGLQLNLPGPVVFLLLVNLHIYCVKIPVTERG